MWPQPHQHLRQQLYLDFMVDQSNPSDGESLIIPITDESSQKVEEVPAGTVSSTPPVELPVVETPVVEPPIVEMTGSSTSPQTIKQTESFVSSETPITDEAPSAVEPPQVAISGNGNNVPKWFYLIFGITLIVFFAITTLLVLSLTKKSPPKLPTPSSAIVQPTSSSVSAATPTLIPLPTVTNIPAGGQNTVSNSDAISDLENDINKTDLSDIEGDLTALDSQVDTTPQ